MYKPIHQILLIATLLASPIKADTLRLAPTNAEPGADLQLPFGFLNENQIVAMQFDLVYAPDQLSTGTPTATSSTSNHQIDSRTIAPGTRRMVLYSTSNQIIPNENIVEIPIALATTLPAGGPTLAVRNIVLTNHEGESFTPTIDQPQIDAWRLANFSDAELATPHVIGDDRDPDGDGLTNLFEFLMGGDPKLQEPSRTVSSLITDTETPDQRTFTISFWVAKDVEDATLQVESSDDTATWGASGIILTPTGNEDARSIEFVVGIPFGGESPRHFVRLVGGRAEGK